MTDHEWGDAPGLLVVDLSRKRADPALETSVPAVVEAADRTADLLAVAREAGVPVCYSRGGKSYYTSEGVDLPDVERGGWAKQNDLRDETPAEAERALEIAPAVEPREEEPVVTKTAPSALFGSMLPVYLSSMGVDTLVVAGIMTSCCVRATVSDAFAHDYWVVLPEECLADRRQAAHEYHVAEMGEKFADVVDLEAAAAYLRAAG